MNHLIDLARHRKAERPPSKVGTLQEQLLAVELYLANPYRRIDREAAWQLARRLAIPHARRAA